MITPPIIEPGEHIIYKAHRHWYIFLIDLLTIVIFALAPLFLFLIPNTVLKTFVSAIFIFDGSSFLLGLLFYTSWLLLCWVAAVLIWTDYYLDAWIVTDQRIIAIDQQGMFHRKMSTFRPEMIQDVTVHVPGVLATLIKYGTIRVQTAGQPDGFIFKGVADPNKLKGYIVEQQRLAKSSPMDKGIQSPQSGV